VIYSIAIDGAYDTNRGSAQLSYNLVTAPPVIAVGPQTRGVTNGTSVTLSISMAASATTLGYQWQYYSTNLPGANASSYTRPSFQSAHQGNYQVVVTNMAGAAT